MKRILQLALLAVTLFSNLSFTFQKDDNKVAYYKSRPLTWADFKGKPNYGIDDAALTASETKSNSSWSNDSATVNLQFYFDKTKSWVKPDKKTDYLLKHEQGHFDLSAVYYRKLVKALKETKFYAKTFQTELKRITNTNSDELLKQQALYDKETNHSIIEPKQHEWDTKIASQLKEFEAYTDSKVSIKLW